MTNFSLSQFSSNIAKKGLASPNKFRIRFTMPSVVNNPKEVYKNS